MLAYQTGLVWYWNAQGNTIIPEGNSYSLQLPECGHNTLMFAYAYEMCICSCCIYIIWSARASAKIGLTQFMTFVTWPFFGISDL